jgi:hypothetical protein
MMAEDQRYRRYMVMSPGVEQDSLARALGIASPELNAHFSRWQAGIDSANLLRVEAIFKSRGYPGKSLVGEPTNEAAFYIVQHSGRIRAHFPLIDAAGRKGELPRYLTAMMQDRLLMEAGKEQIYGTQFAGFAREDTLTHQQTITWFLWPVKDMAGVYQRRKKAGIKGTIAENAASQGIEPEFMSLREVKKKCPWLFPTKKK